MGHTNNINITANEINLLSGQLLCGPRLLRKWLDGKKVSPLSRVRIERGLRSLGRDDLVSAVLARAPR
jgi:hypothetical protein